MEYSYKPFMRVSRVVFEPHALPGNLMQPPLPLRFLSAIAIKILAIDPV